MVCRSWDYMTGKQLDCCTLAEATSQAGEVGLAEDGAMSPAAALAQSNAAKHALGDDSDADMGECQVCALASHMR